MAAPVTFLLTPGSYNRPESQEHLKAAFEAKGQKARYVDLLSSNDGSRLPPATQEEDAEHIREIVLDELDNVKRNVILVVHSYSGIPGSSAVKGLSKKDRSAAGKSTAVVGMVFVSSFVAEVGESLRSYVWDYMPEEIRVGQPGQYLGPLEPAMIAFCVTDGDGDPQEASRFSQYFQKHSNDSWSGKCSYAAWRDIPSLQLIGEKDVVTPREVQEKMYQHTVDAGANVKKVVIESRGHCTNMTAPDLVVKEVLSWAEEI